MDNERKFVLINEFLSSSDDSDDELLLLSNIFERRNIQKIDNFVDVIRNFDNEQFRMNFRLNKSLYENLKKKFEISQHYPKNHPGKLSISAEVHILSFLWFAANKATIRETGILFNIAESTFENCLGRVMNFLIDKAPSIIKFPDTEEQKQVVANEFKKISGIPGVIGCLDGSYIDIRTPAHKIKSTYINRHDKVSITLQAICDSSKKFLDVFTGTSSRIHDARIYELSFISKTIPSICDARYFLLGDGAYPIREWLLKPYKDYGNLTRKEKKYNTKLSATRVKIENAFGLLKARFRQLLRLEFLSVEKQSKFIIAVCVLLNLCIEEGDELEEVYVPIITTDTSSQQEYVESDNTLKQNGERKRNEIANLLFNS